MIAVFIPNFDLFAPYSPAKTGLQRPMLQTLNLETDYRIVTGRPNGSRDCQCFGHMYRERWPILFKMYGCQSNLEVWMVCVGQRMLQAISMQGQLTIPLVV